MRQKDGSKDGHTDRYSDGQKNRSSNQQNGRPIIGQTEQVIIGQTKRSNNQSEAMFKETDHQIDKCINHRTDRKSMDKQKD